MLARLVSRMHATLDTSCCCSHQNAVAMIAEVIALWKRILSGCLEGLVYF